MLLQQQNFNMRQLIILATVFLLGGCASSPDILSDYDSAADFGAYKTYNFMDGAGPDYEGYQSLFSKYAIEAITVEMEKRGYTKSNDPDLLINFGAKLDDKIDVRTSPAPAPMMAGGYYGYRGGAYGGWVGYGYSVDTHVSQYTEGTFNIDLVDAERQQLVWEAVGIGRITEKKRKNLEETVKTGVANFFAAYPFVAGNPNPVPAE